MGTVAKYLAQAKLLAANYISLIYLSTIFYSPFSTLLPLIYLLFNKMNSLSIFILVVVIAQFTIAEEKPENTTVTSPSEDVTQHEVIENKNSQSDEFMAKNKRIKLTRKRNQNQQRTLLVKSLLLEDLD